MKPLEEQFRQLYERYSDEVHSFCVRRVGRAAADDAASEVFTVVWRRLQAADLEAERAWIYGIARNVIRNQWRSSQRRDRLARKVKWVREAEPTQPEEQALLKDQHSVVQTALNSLRAADREILILSAWDELTGAEIAMVLGISKNTVRQRLHRAKIRLAAALDDLEPSFSHKTEKWGQP